MLATSAEVFDFALGQYELPVSRMPNLRDEIEKAVDSVSEPESEQRTSREELSCSAGHVAKLRIDKEFWSGDAFGMTPVVTS